MSFRIVARGEGDLKTRYRPQRLSEVCPTFPIKEAVAILENPNASQVYLFEGLTGCGKTTLARIIARAAICESEDAPEKPCLECESCRSMEVSPDFLEINIANFRGIDAIREKVRDMGLYGGFLSRKIYIFDEVHQLTPAAQELLNKVLEEPKGNTLIFLCTTHKKGLKRTLLGRCAKINFKRMTWSQCKDIIAQVTSDADADVPSKGVLEDLFHKADGSVRDLLNLLDKVVLGTYSVGVGAGDEAPTTGSPDIFAFVKALITKDWPTVVEFLKSENVKNNPDGYRETICTFLARDAVKFNEVKMSIANALGHLGGSLSDEPVKEQYNLFVLRCMRVCYKKT